MLKYEMSLEDLLIVLRALRMLQDHYESQQNSKETRKNIRSVRAIIESLEAQDPHLQTLRRVERELL